MCGIAGFIGKENSEIGKKMIQAIAYRGPDHQGIFHKNNVCFAHARLSIIDVSACSNQPMLNDAETIVLTFNGEIYNYLDLKKKLTEKFQCSFKTNSDTEVIIKLYEIYGIDMLDMLSGMFVFALYDFNLNRLLIARDRMGKKPLYYALMNQTLIFGSEIKAVLQHPQVSKEYNIEAINQYLTFDYIPTPLSLYKQVCKLEPAHFLIYQHHELTIESYWQYHFTTNHNIGFKEAQHQLDNLLNEATHKRLMSDVPLGIFLSGGLDSSTIAYYAQKNAAQKIKTFSIGFEDPSYDEKDYALQVSQHLNTEHYVDILSPQTTLELMAEIFKKLDEPFADASIIPTYFLSKFTRQHVTVALGGDGSDELLAGYPTFISEKTTFLLRYFPTFFSKFLLNVHQNLFKPSDNNIALDFKINQYLRGFLSKPHHIHQLWLGSFLPAEKKLLFNKETLLSLENKSGLTPIDIHFGQATKFAQDEWHKIIYYYCKTYLLDDILFKVDRASMYNSLEVRAPFLDRNVVEFINTLPQQYKIKHLNGKHILKSLMYGRLPTHIIDRPKKGFGIPLSKWIKHELKSEIESVLLENDTMFNKTYIQQLLQEHQTSKRNHRKLIWNLYCLKKIWLQNLA